jgi:hypothetical protein
MQIVVAILSFSFLGTVVTTAVLIGIARRLAPDTSATLGILMNDNQQTLDPRMALVDIQALVRVALESADLIVMRRDLELILTITEEALTAGSKVAGPKR